jgi:hypothetical protein
LVCHIGNSGEWAIIASTTAPSHGHAAGNAAARGFFAFHHRPVARFFIRSQRVVMKSFLRRQTSQSFHVASFLLVVLRKLSCDGKKPWGLTFADAILKVR